MPLYIKITMNYLELCKLYGELEGTSKRLGKTKLLADFISKVELSQLGEVMLLVQGLVYPAWDERKLGFSSNYVIKALAVAAGVSVDEIKELWRETGDLGECAKILIGKKKQATLLAGKLSVEKVFFNLRKLAGVEGEGSVDVKVGLVAELLSSADEAEAKFVVKTVLDELRVGLGEGTLRDALVWAFLPAVVGINFEKEGFVVNEKTIVVDEFEEIKLKKIDNYNYIYCEDKEIARKTYNLMLARVQNALDICNDFGVVAAKLKEKGFSGLKEIELVPGKPVKVMLAQKEDTVESAFERVGKPAAIEYKLDGFRLQVHKFDNEIKLFTRRLENVTKQFPDVVALVKNNVVGKNFILDCEVVGVDKVSGKFLPFQSISQRIKRKYDISDMAEEFPVQVHVFDLLYYNNSSLMKAAFSERRKKILEIVKENKSIKIIGQLQTDSEEEAARFYKKSLEVGNEGVMLKNLNAAYKPGSRVGYMVKLKETMETLDLVIVGAEWGEGKRSKWLSSYVLACRNENTGELLVVGRVSTGLKEKGEEGLSFGELTEELKPLVLEQKGKKVIVKPQIVIEVSFEEIQKSPGYSSGFALRFPRVVRLREDRDAKSCSTLAEVGRMYEGQM